MSKTVDEFLSIAREMDRQGEREAAIENLSKAIELDPHSFTGYMQRGHQYTKKGDLHNALSDYTHAANVDVGSYLPHYHKGETLARLGDIVGACSAYREALQRNPDTFSAKRIQEFIAANCG